MDLILPVNKITLKAVVTRTDGSVEDLGTVATYDKDAPESENTITILKESSN